MFKKVRISIAILSFIIFQNPAYAQLANAVDQAVRYTLGEHFNDHWMKMAAKNAEEITQTASHASSKAEAVQVIKKYQACEMTFVEKSWKFNDCKPRDYFRTHTANSLKQLKTKYGVVPNRNFIERFIIKIDNMSS